MREGELKCRVNNNETPVCNYLQAGVIFLQAGENIMEKGRNYRLCYSLMKTLRRYMTMARTAKMAVKSRA